MALIERVRVAWSGWPGEPGVSTFYCDSASTLLPLLRTFFLNWQTICPSGLVFTFPSGGEILSDTTGIVSSAWSASAPATITCTGAGNYSGRTGMVMGWTTSLVIGRHLLKGRTFFVPIVDTAYSPDGTIANGSVTSAQTAANTLVGASSTLKIWHRPSSLGAADGDSALVTSAKIRDRVQVMTSRAT